MLPLVPGRAQTQLGPPTREDVEGGDVLASKPGVAVRHAAHQQPEAQTVRLGRRERQGRVALEHRFFGRPEHLHLEPVVHDRQRPHPDGLRRLCQRGQGGPDRLGAAGPGEARYMDVEVHQRPPVPGEGSAWRVRAEGASTARRRNAPAGGRGAQPTMRRMDAIGGRDRRHGRPRSAQPLHHPALPRARHRPPRRRASGRTQPGAPSPCGRRRRRAPPSAARCSRPESGSCSSTTEPTRDTLHRFNHGVGRLGGEQLTHDHLGRVVEQVTADVATSDRRGQRPGLRRARPPLHRAARGRPPEPRPRRRRWLGHAPAQVGARDDRRRPPWSSLRRLQAGHRAARTSEPPWSSRPTSLAGRPRTAAPAAGHTRLL